LRRTSGGNFFKRKQKRHERKQGRVKKGETFIFKREMEGGCVGKLLRSPSGNKVYEKGEENETGGRRGYPLTVLSLRKKRRGFQEQGEGNDTDSSLRDVGRPGAKWEPGEITRLICGGEKRKEGPVYSILKGKGCGGRKGIEEGGYPPLYRGGGRTWEVSRR